jgi:hypothetical protein
MKKIYIAAAVLIAVAITEGCMKLRMADKHIAKSVKNI